MSYTLTGDFEPEVNGRISDELKTELNSSTDVHRHIRDALDHYSRHKPDTYVADITGDGGFDYELSTSNFPSWVDGFSVVTDVDYPHESTEAEPNWLERTDWFIYEGLSGTTPTKYLRFKFDEPSASETIRVHYTVPYVFDASEEVTVPTQDFRAICNKAAAMTLRAIAGKFTALGDSTMGADTVNYRTKARDALAVAKVYEEDYRAHLGIKEKDEAPPAVVQVDMDTEFSFHADFLTHPQRWR